MEAYNASQDKIHVNYTSFSSMDQEYWTKILVMMAAREDVDVVGVNAVTDYVNFCNKGVLAPLNDLIEESGFDMSGYGALTDQFGIVQDDGSVTYYALPHRAGAYCVFVNKTLFEAAGLEVPYDGWTWEEFIDMTQKMTLVREDGTQQWGSAPRGLCVNTPAFGAILHGQSLVGDDISHFRDGMEILNQLLVEKKSSPSYTELYQNPSAVTAGNFQAGVLACHILGDWGVTNMKRYEREGTMDPSVDWDVVPLPHFEDMESGITYVSAVMTGITSYTEKKAEAFDFLKFLCGPEGAKIIAANGTRPGYMNEEVRQAYLDLDPELNLKAFTDATVMAESLPHPAANDVQQVTIAQTELYLIGEKDLDTMMADLETERLAAIENATNY